MQIHGLKLYKHIIPKLINLKKVNYARTDSDNVQLNILSKLYPWKKFHLG